MKLFNKKAINKINLFKYKNNVNINKSAIFFKTITSKNTTSCINNKVWRNYCSTNETTQEETSSTEITQQQEEIFAEKVVDPNKATLAQQKALDSEFITSLPGFNTIESPHFTEIALAIHRYQQTEEYEKLSDKEKIRMRILKAQLVIQSRIPFDVKNAYAVPLEESTKKVQISFVGLDKRMAVSMSRIKQAMDLCPGLIKISGIVPLPKKIKRMALLSSPFKYGRARENYALIKYRRLIQYWTDSDNQKKFLEFMKRFMEPTLACKVTEFNYFPIDEYFTRDQYVFDGKHESLVTPENVRVSPRALQNK